MKKRDIFRKVIDIDQVISSDDFGTLENIINDAKIHLLESGVHDSKNESGKGKDDEKPKPPPILP